MNKHSTRTKPDRRIWAAVLVLLILAILAGGYGYYRHEAERIRQEKYDDIATIAEMKAEQIAQWKKERMADVWRAVNGPTVIKNLGEILKNPDAAGFRDELRKILEVNRKGDLYANVLLFAPDGQVILAAKEHLESMDSITRQTIASALAKRESVLSDFFGHSDGIVHIDAAAAVRDAEGRPLAAMLLRSNAKDHLYPMVQSWPTRSRSAETLVVQHQGEEVVVLNELRHRAGTALSLRIPLTQADSLAVQAALGKQGFFQGRDYRDVEVLADLRPIPGLPWSMVAKVDTNEILAETRYRAGGTAVMVILLILLAAAVTAFAYRQQQVGFFRGLYGAERQKREAQERYRTTLYSIGDGVITTDADGRVQEINPVAEALTGWKHAEAEGKPLEEVFRIVSEETRATVENPVERVLRDGVVVGLANHTLLIARDGTECPIADSAAPIRAENGAVSGVVLVFRDQTAERAAGNALRESEERFRMMVEGVKDYAILMLDPTGHVVSWNAGAERLKRYRAEDIIRQHFSRFYPKEDVENGKPQRELAAAAAEGRFEDEGWRVRKDGSRFWANVTITALRDKAGQLRGFAKITRDMTERRRAEEALRTLNAELEQRVEERTRDLTLAKEAAETATANEVAARQQIEQAARDRTFFFSVNLDMFCIAGFDGYFKDFNPSWERILGYSSDELRAKPFIDFVHPEDRQSTLDAAAALSCGEDVVAFENRYRCKDGSYRWIKWTSRSVIDEGLIFAAAHDVTDSKRLEIELRLAKDAAEAANRAKSEFLANVSHEVRTPMNAIMGMTDLVLETPLTGEQKRFLTTVRESADSLLGVLNDILDFAKIESGRLDIEETPFGLRDVVEGTATALAERAHRKGLELACHLTPEVPDMLVGDPGRLRQILVNLIGNAIKFTSRGEVVVRVSVESAGEHDATLHFSVADTGIGIPLEKQKVIFEPFRQADASVTREYGGTGLGLAISSQLAARMNGRVWAESETGKGSIFHFTARLGVAKGVKPHLPARIEDLKGMRVLIVDDNATNRLIYEEVTGAWGMQPTAADSGQQALAVADTALAVGNPFALVMLDRQMPGMDGYQVAARLRGKPEFADLVIIMLSSTGDLGDAERRRELGISACLIKPVRQSELLNSIMRAMGLVTNGKHKPAETPSVRPLKVLLAEDYPLNQELAVQFLERRGHTVVVAENGQEALRRLEAEDFDVVLMDVQMPVMDGFAATAAIRDPKSSVRRHDIPIVAMTAHAMKGDEDRCLAAGMNAYVSKPFTAATLTGALAKFFGTESYMGVQEPATGTPDAILFDRAVLLDHADGDAALARKMATRFLEDVVVRLTSLEESVEAFDVETCHRHVHTLKGAAATFGACRAQAVCQCLETAVREGDIQTAKTLIAEVKREIGALEQVLREFVKT
jgi:PAS domain S-box-containing protein